MEFDTLSRKILNKTMKDERFIVIIQMTRIILSCHLMLITDSRSFIRIRPSDSNKPFPNYRDPCNLGELSSPCKTESTDTDLDLIFTVASLTT